MLDKLVQYSGNPNSPYEAGIYGSRRNCFGALEILCARSMRGAALYRFWVQSSPRWDKTTKWELLKLNKTDCVISMSKRPYHQTKYNCLCTQGMLATMPQIKGLPLAKVRELQCASEGADSCVYEVRWIEQPPRFWASVRFTMGLAAGVVVGLLFDWNTWTYAITLVLAVAGYFMGRALDYRLNLTEVRHQNDEQAQALLESLRVTEKLNAELQRKIEERTQALSTANKYLTQAMADLKATEEKVLIAEKQAAIGVLAGGMAHEINNPVNAIRLSAQTMLEYCREEVKIRPQLEVIVRATTRCKRIIDEMLSLAREPKRELAVRIENIVEMAVDVFTVEHPSDIRVTKHIMPGLPALKLDMVQIQQVIMNLLRNAADALKYRGEIKVSLAHEGNSIVLKVIDHGCGISEVDRGRVFDPFFTTKRPGRGIGLGLSISYQLVKRNGGTIEVASEEGKGTTFTMKFPVLEGGPGAEGKPA
jgi:signal transduction histidine kinase